MEKESLSGIMGKKIYLLKLKNATSVLVNSIRLSNAAVVVMAC